MSKWDYIKEILAKTVKNSDNANINAQKFTTIPEEELYKEYMQNKKSYSNKVREGIEIADLTGNPDTYYEAINDGNVYKHLLNELIEQMSRSDYPEINDIINTRDPNFPKYRHYRR